MLQLEARLDVWEGDPLMLLVGLLVMLVCFVDFLTPDIDYFFA